MNNGGANMLKLVVIAVLLLLGALATKYLDEKLQQKALIGLGIVIAFAVIGFMSAELMR